MPEVDLLIKLFDTLKDALRDTNQLCQAMLANQNSIGSHVKNLPIAELKEALKDHSKESTDDIGTCTETVETQTHTILDEVKELKGKVKTMIIVVIVAFTLFTSAVLIANLSLDTDEKSNMSKEQIIETIRKELRKQKP